MKLELSNCFIGEDSIVTAKLLGIAIIACLHSRRTSRHSHDYTLKQDFCRHFDMGLARMLIENFKEHGESKRQCFAIALINKSYGHAPL